MSVVEICRARLDDAAIVANLLLEAFVPFKAAYTPDAFEYTTAKADTIASRFSEGPIWLANYRGEPVGTVSGLPEPDRFYIRSMAVKPSAQGLGIGQKLLETLEIYAKEKGFTKLYLYTTHVLPGARPLYEKNGFRIIRETGPDEWFGMGGIEMEKDMGHL